MRGARGALLATAPAPPALAARPAWIRDRRCASISRRLFAASAFSGSSASTLSIASDARSESPLRSAALPAARFSFTRRPISARVAASSLRYVASFGASSVRI